MAGYTVWKENLNIERGIQEIALPEGAEILTVREQQSAIAMWFHCDPSRILIKRRFIVVSTDGAAPTLEASTYIGTASLEDGKFIFHIFELLDIDILTLN